MADLAELLLSRNEIDWSQLESARGQQAYTGGRLEHILVESRMVDEQKLADAIARVTGAKRVSLDDREPDGAALAKLKADQCWTDVVYPVSLQENGRHLFVAVTDPTDLGLVDTLSQRSGCRVTPIVAGLYEIRRAVRRYYFHEEVETPDAKPAATGEEAFKITDMSGNTVMTSMDVLRRQAEAGKAAPEPPPPPIGENLGGDYVDDLFNPSALGPEEMARIEKLRVNQEKSGKVLRALLELLGERGILTPAEVKAKTH